VYYAIGVGRRLCEAPMSNKKIITTLSYLINTGISSLLFYDRERHKKLEKAKAIFDKDQLIFIFNNKKYILTIQEEEKNGQQ
jgi:hypothetical protein